MFQALVHPPPAPSPQEQSHSDPATCCQNHTQTQPTAGAPPSTRTRPTERGARPILADPAAACLRPSARRCQQLVGPRSLRPFRFSSSKGLPCCLGRPTCPSRLLSCYVPGAPGAVAGREEGRKGRRFRTVIVPGPAQSQCCSMLSALRDHHRDQAERRRRPWHLRDENLFGRWGARGSRASAGSRAHRKCPPRGRT